MNTQDLKILAGDFMSHPLSRGISDCEKAGEALFDAAQEIDRLRKIEFAAKEMYRVKGRFNTQTATCRLGELLGEKVHWPEKNRQCIETATFKTPNALAQADAACGVSPGAMGSAAVDRSAVVPEPTFNERK